MHSINSTNICDRRLVLDGRSLRIFYGDKAGLKYRSTQERWNMQRRALVAMEAISGYIAYSGAEWRDPLVRGGHLRRFLVRICRAYALTKWNVPYTVTFMEEDVVDGGFAEKVGHRHVEWSIAARNCCAGNVDVAFLWLTRDEVIADLEAYLARPAHGIASGVYRLAQH